jgi:ammonia channel protein AmtB
LYGGTTQIIAQVAEVASIFVFVFGLSYVFFKVLAALKLLRVSREVELQGLDLPEMGALGYPVDWEPSDLEGEGRNTVPGTSVKKAFGAAD